MEKQGLIEVVARGMWEETEASNGCAQPNMDFWRERASERLGEIWEEGRAAGSDNQYHWDGWRHSKGYPITNPYT